MRLLWLLSLSCEPGDTTPQWSCSSFSLYKACDWSNAAGNVARCRRHTAENFQSYGARYSGTQFMCHWSCQQVVNIRAACNFGAMLLNSRSQLYTKRAWA